MCFNPGANGRHYFNLCPSPLQHFPGTYGAFGLHTACVIPLEFLFLISGTETLDTGARSILSRYFLPIKTCTVIPEVYYLSLLHNIFDIIVHNSKSRSCRNWSNFGKKVCSLRELFSVFLRTSHLLTGKHIKITYSVVFQDMEIPRF